MICKNCGAELPENENICSKCGAECPVEYTVISAAGNERAVPRGFSAKKNIIIIAMAAILLLGGGITAVAVTNINSPAQKISRTLTLAERYLTEQNYEQAIIEYQKALEIEPLNADIYLKLAETYIANGNDDLALETLEIGYEKTKDERIQMKIYELRKPLTAEELSWILKPSYDFESVKPILQHNFSVSPLGYVNGKNKLVEVEYVNGCDIYEASFPSYSFIEEYYEIQQGDTYNLFYMPDSIMSPLKSIEPLTILNDKMFFNIDSDLTNWEQIYDVTENPPWNVIETRGLGGSLNGGIIWDSSTQRAYLDFSFLGAGTFKPVSPKLLSKNYPVKKYDLSAFGDIPQDEYDWTWDDESYNDEHYQEIMSAVNIPIDTKYALFSPENKLLTDFVYDDMSVCSYGITAACRNGKWGYLDESGKEITEFIYDAPWFTGYDFDQETRERVKVYAGFPCTCDTMVVSKDGELGVIYRNGRTIIEFGSFEDLAPAWNDQLWAKQNGKWGLVDLAAVKKYFGLTSTVNANGATSEPENLSQTNNP